MPSSRTRLRPWLEQKIESKSIPGLTWVDKGNKMFAIPWKHAARHGWEMDTDARIFMQWAVHTGKFKPGVTEPDPKTWKANFRSALNSLPDIKQVKDKSINKGSQAIRVYRMLEEVPKKKGLSVHHFGDEGEAVECSTTVEVIADSTNEFYGLFQVSPIHTTGADLFVAGR
ncbi:hypothetical protein Z043_124317 [Scleropages formosus]|uniref:IRF tryptophan pentad repeat domain-containing protein n=1 Tax=Scleropages formosus TaxID=113540 RepID=A0A0P7TA52_SCLFO|nr:hypothetical protein Z043_124317 [Scleropages formosus]